LGLLKEANFSERRIPLRCENHSEGRFTPRVARDNGFVMVVNNLKNVVRQFHRYESERG
jgi:hypothetical protein